MLSDGLDNDEACRRSGCARRGNKSLSLTLLSLIHLIAGSYPIGGYLDYILLVDKPKLE